MSGDRWHEFTDGSMRFAEFSGLLCNGFFVFVGTCVRGDVACMAGYMASRDAWVRGWQKPSEFLPIKATGRLRWDHWPHDMRCVTDNFIRKIAIHLLASDRVNFVFGDREPRGMHEAFWNSYHAFNKKDQPARLVSVCFAQYSVLKDAHQLAARAIDRQPTEKEAA